MIGHLVKNELEECFAKFAIDISGRNISNHSERNTVFNQYLMLETKKLKLWLFQVIIHQPECEIILK
jgi:hypothetical protein